MFTIKKTMREVRGSKVSIPCLTSGHYSITCGQYMATRISRAREADREKVRGLEVYYGDRRARHGPENLGHVIRWESFKVSIIR